MKNRLISLLVALLLILFCFAGCAEKTGEEVMNKIGEEASKDAISISIYLMSEEPVSAAQELLMEEKVNEITEANNNIHIDLKYYTADTYYTVLEADLAEMKDYYGNGAVGKDLGDPVYTDENGLPAVYYPPIEEFDVDIFYFGGYDKYATYKANGYLRNLDEEIEGSSKALKATVNKTLIEQFKAVNGMYDAIPTNRTIGEYTYILLNKDILAKTTYSASQITSLVSEECQDLLDMVAEEYPDYVPLYSATGVLDVLDVKYFGAEANGIAKDGFSVLGSVYNTAWTNGAEGSYPVMGSVFSGAPAVADQIKVLREYDINGYYGDENSDKPFAVGYVKGGPEVVTDYGDDYAVVPVAMPTIEHEDLYESLFAISQYTNSVSGSAEILTMLNTDEEFRNLILYGVEGENYIWTDSEELDANGNAYRVVSRQTKDPDKLYVLDPVKTGNVYLAYPAEGEDPLASKYLLEQNADLVIDYILGFSFYDGLKAEKIDATSYAALMALQTEADTVYAEILAADTEAKFEAAMTKLKALEETDNYKAVMADGESATSPYAYYMSWLAEKSLYIAPATDAE